MQTQANLKSKLQPIGSYIFNFGLLSGFVALIFGLASCGGAGGSGTQNNPDSSALTIDSITPTGLVASSVFQTLTIAGTNFASGVTISITNGSGVPIVSSVSVAPTLITAQVKIDTTPSNRYVLVSLQKGSENPVTHVLGVAGVRKTFSAHIQPIFETTASGVSCTMCHSGATPSGGMNLNSLSYLYNEPSQGCSSRLRVTPGDPRRSSSVLIDKIKVASTGIPACNGNLQMPPSGYSPLNAQEIQDIVDWVAGGAN